MARIIEKAEVLEQLRDGLSIMIGGFLACGTPDGLIDLLIEKGVQDLTIIGNDTGFPDRGIGRLVVSRQAKKVIASHIGTNPETGIQMNAGTLEVELCPQGTLIERIRAAGAGLGGILTPTGVGTVVEEGKEKKVINGIEYLLELPIKADLALVKAWKADKKGNLVFRNSARNFNPIIATAAETVIVEAEEIVEVGEIDPNMVMTPGIFVDYIYKGGSNE
jgi:acetate CoA/acetoacetate CoA-transferase alpha subunit